MNRINVQSAEADLMLAAVKFSQHFGADMTTHSRSYWIELHIERLSELTRSAIAYAETFSPGHQGHNHAMGTSPCGDGAAPGDPSLRDQDLIAENGRLTDELETAKATANGFSARLTNVSSIAKKADAEIEQLRARLRDTLEAAEAMARASDEADQMLGRKLDPAHHERRALIARLHTEYCQPPTNNPTNGAKGQ